MYCSLSRTWQLVALTLAIRSTRGNPNCVTGPEPTTGACYWKVATSADWKAALKTCQDAGGTLAMVKSAAIHSFLNTAGLLSGYMWLGGSCGLVLGVWRWADTEAFTWERWHNTQPDGPKSGQVKPCLYNYDGDWYDSACYGTNRNFLCQSEPVTCTDQKKCLTTAFWDITNEKCLSDNWESYSNVPLTTCQQLCRERVDKKCMSFKYSSATQDCVINKVGVQTGATLSACPGWEHYERAEPVPSVLSTCYEGKSMGATRNVAKTYCESVSMELVKIDSQAEDDHINSLTHLDIWLSLHNVGLVSTFKYSDGTYPQWSNWGNGKPMDKSGSSTNTHVQRLSSGKWEAKANNNNVNYVICEKPRAASCDAAASVPGASKTVDYQLSVVVYTCNPGWAFSDGSVSRYVTCHCEQAGMDADVVDLGECTVMLQGGPTTTLLGTTTQPALSSPSPTTVEAQDTTTSEHSTESISETVSSLVSHDSTTDSTTREVTTTNSIVSESVLESVLPTSTSSTDPPDSILLTSTSTRVTTNAEANVTGTAAEDFTVSTMASAITSLPQFGGDLEWDVWTPWTECTHPCGPLGRHYRIKLCSDQHAHDCDMLLPTRDGDKIYYHIDEGSCNSAPCSVDGAWSEWSNWANCSATCGEGTQRRSRSCDSPPPQYDGEACAGGGTQAISCSANATCKVVSPQVEDGPIFTEADSRPSAQGIGSIEVSLVLVLLLALVIMDIGKCHRDSKRCIRNIRRKRKRTAAK